MHCQRSHTPEHDQDGSCVYRHGKTGPPQHEGDDVQAEEVTQPEERLGGLAVGRSADSEVYWLSFVTLLHLYRPRHATPHGWDTESWAKAA